jgi:hypothetical protein
MVCIKPKKGFCFELREITGAHQKKRGKAIAFGDTVKGFI